MNDETWVRYSNAQHDAVLWAFLAAMFAVFWWQFMVRYVEGFWPVVACFFIFGFVYLRLLDQFWKHWNRAKHIKRMAEAEGIAAAAFATILATTVLKILTEVADVGKEGGD